MRTRLPLRIGTRGSPLALVQARMVRAALAAADPDLAAEDAVEIRVVSTTGDRVRDRPLAEIGGKGLFTKEIEDGLLDGSLDLAVHSMKDVPTFLPAGLVIAATLPRADPRDALIANGTRRIADLPAGAVVGTASLRRAAQLLAARPDLRVVPLRGNVGTRLRQGRGGRGRGHVPRDGGAGAARARGGRERAAGAGRDAAGGGAGCGRHRDAGGRRGAARAAGAGEPRRHVPLHGRRAGVPGGARGLVPDADRGAGGAGGRPGPLRAGWWPARTGRGCGGSSARGRRPTPR